MTLKDNTLASVLVGICQRSSDLDLILYGKFLENHGAIPLEISDELQEPIVGHQGPTTD